MVFLNPSTSRRSYVSVLRARNRIEQFIIRHQTPSYETIPVWNSYNRVLAEDIVSTINIPAYHSSHMDGYAVKAEDIIHASCENPVVLNLITNRIKPRKRTGVLLSTPTNVIVRKHEAFRIMTGGYLPKGANTVIPIEETQQLVDRENKAKVYAMATLPRGSFVYHRGRDIKKGYQLMNRGKILRPQDTALLASLHITKVTVFRKPKVAIIATGGELTDKLDDDDIKSGKVLDTHSHIISRLVEELGGIPFRMGLTADDIAKIRSKIEDAIAKSMDLILTLGGSSVGKYDLVEAAINSMGKPDLLFHGVKIDRGRVTGLAITKGRPIIIMPGPIQGAMNAFLIFASPILKLLSGQPKEKKQLTIPAILTKEWHARKKFPNFTKILYVNLRGRQDGDFEAEPIIGETESLSMFVKANGYTIVPEKTTYLNRGQKVKVHLLSGLSYVYT
jgi:molybdenum cofactor synthesis domain-containing protein